MTCNPPLAKSGLKLNDICCPRRLFLIYDFAFIPLWPGEEKCDETDKMNKQQILKGKKKIKQGHKNAAT